MNAPHNTNPANTDTLYVMFYNVENLFDDLDDPVLHGDDEFSESGLRAWNSTRFNSKIKKISQAILASNEWERVHLIGLVEIENRNVLNELCTNSLLHKAPYKILHRESPDHRGIDVGLLYDSTRFHLIDSGFYKVKTGIDQYSREILYAKLSMPDDTLNVFVCHWPSRYSGALSSESKRMLASEVLRQKCIELYDECEKPNIIIMGDFNDEPDDYSLRNLVENDDYQLINLMNDDFDLGTIKYQNQWYLFDQFIVSGNLSKETSDLHISGKPEICSPSFLLVKDEKYLGIKPFRTFTGYRYNGGYSDHLPIRLKLIYH